MATLYMVVQFLIKAVSTCATVWFLWWIWHADIDVRKLFTRPVTNRLEKLSQAIPTIDQHAIYQNGIIVAKILGEPKQQGDHWLFGYIHDAQLLDRSKVFEYHRKKLRFVSADGFASMMFIGGGGVLQHAYKNVVCQMAPP